MLQCGIWFRRKSISFTNVYESASNSKQKISVSDEAYLRLSELKLKNESFTELIYRLTNKSNVPDLKGIMSEDEGKSIEKNIREPRKMSKERVDRTTDELNRKVR